MTLLSDLLSPRDKSARKQDKGNETSNDGRQASESTSDNSPIIDNEKKDKARKPFFKRLSSAIGGSKSGASTGHSRIEQSQASTPGAYTSTPQDATNRTSEGVDHHDVETNDSTSAEDGPSLVPNLTGSVTLVETYAIFEGNYSNIFLGEWNGSKVAVKAIRQGAYDEKTVMRKLSRERDVWILLRHDHILPLYGFCKQFGRFGSLISPWYENGHARKYIERRSPSASQRFILWCGMVEGVAYLHSHDPALVHGDLKPANVLIDDQNRPRICDFGLVKVLADRSTGWTTTTSHTGTLRYLAYELANENGFATVSMPGDIYAVGCLALEIIFLRSPYAIHENPSAIYRDIGNGIPPATSLPVIGNPSESIIKFWELIQTCWATDPNTRPSAKVLQKYATDHRDALVSALESNLEIAPRVLH